MLYSYARIGAVLCVLHAGKSRLDSYSLPNSSVLHIFSNLDDDSRRLMAQTKLTGYLITLPIVAIGATDAGSDYLNEHFSITRGNNRSLHNVEFPRACPYDSAVGCWKWRIHVWTFGDLISGMRGAVLGWNACSRIG